ncbi:chemotaxis protein [Roseibium sp. CAU 1637]|uniref:Chemotaxis protein n=1 Tax=Roseibium limicola TaxID=2816037 RepID=A0A939J8S9_9HYPH|nr:methyl-accepting chemotaxis protein [Roseibium limicola]MBO0345621.1 chemotaxis protein [Roseibium limicola]
MTTSVSNSLDRLREAFSKYVVYFIWMNVLLIMVSSWWHPHAPTVILSGAALLVGAAATGTWIKFGTKAETRLATSISLAALVGLLVASMASEGQGSSFQIDAHMYFFAVMAVLTGWVDWRSIVAYSAVVAVHHLTLNFALPWAVFPDGSNFLRVVFHAAIVVVEASILLWVVSQLERAFVGVEKSRTDAEAANIQASSMQQAEEHRMEGERQRQALIGVRIQEFRDEIESKLASVTTQVRQMRDASQNLGGVAEDTSGRASQASRAAETASQNVQTVASAAEELSASINEITRQVDETTRIVAQATDSVQTSNRKVAGLSESANRIGEVVTLIQAIAEQTNLLALNATIEAARAGEAGRGFAVVASEVKELATQTSKATEEIGAQIAAIQGETKDAVEAISAIATTMDQVNNYTATIAAAVDEQGSATNEISRNVAEAANGTGIVASSVGGLTEAAETTTSSAASVADVAAELEREAEQMRQAVDDFLKDVAA